MTTRHSPPFGASPVVLIPGYWLGGWAWDAVTDRLHDSGHRVHAGTLPGLESVATPRANVQFTDHKNAVVETLRREDSPSVLVAHSGGGAVATAALDATPEAVRRVVYVDSGPVSDGHTPRPDLPDDIAEIGLPPLDEMDAMGASLEGLDDNALQRFLEGAVPHPAGAVRERISLRDPSRNNIPATLVCCSITSESVRQLAAAGSEMFAPVAELTDVSFVDLPTGHWPMWSRPIDLADTISAAAEP